jgi:hypothetical protein
MKFTLFDASYTLILSRIRSRMCYVRRFGIFFFFTFMMVYSVEREMRFNNDKRYVCLASNIILSSSAITIVFFIFIFFSYAFKGH